MMAEEPNINLVNNPSTYNLTFGKNIFSFYDENETGTKMGLQIWNNDNTELITRLEQYPNPLGYYHFDIKSILQNYTIPNYSIDDNINITNSSDESFEFNIKFGYINVAGSFVENDSAGSYIVFGGRKRYDELSWNSNPYIAAVSEVGGCPLVIERQKALTDYTIRKPIAEVDGVPDFITAAGITHIYTMKKRRTDEFKLSFMTPTRNFGAFPAAPAGCQALKGFRICFTDEDGSIGSNFYRLNSTSIGGQYSTITSTDAVEYPYYVLSINAGFNEFPTASLGQKYMWITSHTYDGGGSCTGVNDLLENPISEAYRVELLDDNCNDFAPVQVSWLNSFGFRDYWFFNKRTDESVNIKRETYERVEGTWNSDVFSVNSYDRGAQIFSQDLTIEKSINTDYLSDDEALFLKNLFISPDVRVRYDGETEWIPIVIKNTSWNERTFRKDKFFQYTLNYEEAHKINSQRG